MDEQNDQEKEDSATSGKKYLKRFSIPKIIYDIALITFLLPAILYLHAHMYKLGKFVYYNIPADYVEVGYQDIINLWSVPLVFIFIFLLPFYAFFVPSEVLEELIATEEKKKNKSWTDSKWFMFSVKAFYFILMGLGSLAILSKFIEYWYLVKEIYPLFGLIILSFALFWVQSIWSANTIYRRLLKIGSVIFSLILLLLATTGIAQDLGKFQAERKIKYEKICSPEKNLARIGRAGDKIIAKEINPDNSIGEKTVLVGSTCNDLIMLEDSVLTVNPETDTIAK